MPQVELPEGPFSSSDLQWEEKRYMGKLISAATIPKKRLDDFVRGEELLHDVSFSKRKTCPPRKTVKANSKRAKKLNRVIFNCCFGPEDNSGRLPPDSEAHPRPAGTRRKGTDWGEGMKIGCQASFAVVTFINSPDFVEIQYTQKSHLKPSGVPAHPPGGNHRQRYLSEGIKEHIRQAALRQVAPRHILEQVHADQVEAFRAKFNLSSRDEAEARMADPQTKLSRDHHLTMKDISNVIEALVGQDWKYGNDQAQSVDCFAFNNPENVMHYQTMDSKDWMQLWRNVDHCNQETTGGLEAYHRILKEFFLNPSKHGLRARRIDWLISRILGALCSHYMRKQHAGIGYNKAKEDLLRKSVLAAQDEDIVLEISDQAGEMVKVRSRGEEYQVTSPGTPQAACNCVFFMRGNVCKHVLKVALAKDNRLTAGHLMKFLGSMAGTEEGGMDNMYASLEVESRATVNTGASAGTHGAEGAQAVEAGGLPGVSDGGGASEAGVEGLLEGAGGLDAGEGCGPEGGVPASAEVQPALESTPEKETPDLAAAAIAGMHSLIQKLEDFREEAPPDDKFWAQAQLDCRCMELKLQKRIAHGSTGVMESLPTLSVNKEAPEGWSLARLTSFPERGRSKAKQASGRAPLAAESQEQQPLRVIEPFPQLPARKPQQRVLHAAIARQTPAQHAAAVLANQQALAKAERDEARVRASTTRRRGAAAQEEGSSMGKRARHAVSEQREREPFSLLATLQFATQDQNIPPLPAAPEVENEQVEQHAVQPRLQSPKVVTSRSGRSLKAPPKFDC